MSDAAIGDLKGQRSRRQIFDQSVEIHCTYRGRGAIYQFLCSLTDQRHNLVLVPAFHCPMVVDPVIRAGYEVDFYEIDQDLNKNKNDLIKKVRADVAVLVIINFFGFSTKLDDIRQECRRFGCPVLEDCSHSFLHANPCRLAGEQGDAATFSFWKIVPSVQIG